MRGLALPKSDWRLVVGGAVLTCVAYPPFHLLLPSFICLIPAVWLIQGGAEDPRPVRRHLAQGFWFGLASNGLVLYWMVVALWHFTPLSALGYAASMIVLGFYCAALFAAVGWVTRTTGLSLLVVFPVLWTALEWIVGHQGDLRFPWLGLGTSLTGYPTVVQLADLVGARGVTYLLALANVALALAWRRRADRTRAVVLSGSVAVGLLAALTYGVVRERTLELRPAGWVSVLQPNAGYREKWEPERRDSIVRGLLDLAAQAMSDEEGYGDGSEARRPDLIVLPEAALPGYFGEHPAWSVLVGDFSRTTRTPVLLGSLDLAQTDEGVEYFNAAFLFDHRGVVQGYPVYRKRYLVPITEQVPFLSPRIFGGFVAGDEQPVYEVEFPRSGSLVRLGALICYESAFEDLARRYRRRGADFIVNITNDAWFGRTSGPYQHAAHLVMRAIENRVGMARAANSGISEFVDPLGREYQRTALGVRTLQTGQVFTTDAVPPYTRMGDWVGTLALLATALLVGYTAWHRR